MSRQGCVFEDKFVVVAIDDSKFERVSRITAKSTSFDAELVLDVNSDLFPVSNKHMLHVQITNTLLPSGSNANLSEYKDMSSLIGDYEYAMYGRIFKSEFVSTECRTLYASFGGLLMSLTVDKQLIADLQLDMRIYLLARRITTSTR